MTSPDRQQRLAALRDSIANIERKPALAQARVQVEDKTGAFPHVGGGLLQEVFTDERRNAGAVLGFALAQAKTLIGGQRLALIYLQLADEGQKLGLPYGPGLLSFGLDPDALVLVRVANMAEMLGRRGVPGLPGRGRGYCRYRLPLQAARFYRQPASQHALGGHGRIDLHAALRAGAPNQCCAFALAAFPGPELLPSL